MTQRRTIAALALIGLWAYAPVAAAPAAQVLWVGIQQQTGASEDAVAALDSAIYAALSRAVAPGLRVRAETQRSPRARRALREMESVGLQADGPLGDTAARALGLVLEAAAVVRAEVEASAQRVRVTMHAVAVHRGDAGASRFDAAPVPESRQSLEAWAAGVARPAAAAVSELVSDLVRSAPGDAAGFAAAGEDFLKRGWPGLAALEFDRAITAAPREARHYLGSARAYLALGQAQKALHQLERARELAPDNVEVRLQLAQAHQLGGDIEAALEDLKAAAEMGGGAPARMALAAALEQSGDPQGAQAQYEAAAQLDPENRLAARRAAELSALLAGPSDAEALRQAAANTGDSSTARRKLLAACVERGETAEALNQLRLLREQSGASVIFEAREYAALARLLDREMEAILEAARTRWEALEAGTASAQAVIQTLRTMHQRSDALARAAECIEPPPALERGARHRALAYNLLNQSDFALLRYLERRESDYYDQALLARQAAIAELRRARESDAAAGWPTTTSAEQ